MAMSATHRGMIQLLVEQDGRTELSYACRDLAAAGEMFAYLREFFPGATFVIQPLAH